MNRNQVEGTTKSMAGSRRSAKSRARVRPIKGISKQMEGKRAEGLSQLIPGRGRGRRRKTRPSKRQGPDGPAPTPPDAGHPLKQDHEEPQCNLWAPRRQRHARGRAMVPAPSAIPGMATRQWLQLVDPRVCAEAREDQAQSGASTALPSLFPSPALELVTVNVRQVVRSPGSREPGFDGECRRSVLQVVTVAGALRKSGALAGHENRLPSTSVSSHRARRRTRPHGCAVPLAGPAAGNVMRKSDAEVHEPAGIDRRAGGAFVGCAHLIPARRGTAGKSIFGIGPWLLRA